MSSPAQQAPPPRIPVLFFFYLMIWSGAAYTFQLPQFLEIVRSIVERGAQGIDLDYGRRVAYTVSVSIFSVLAFYMLAASSLARAISFQKTSRSTLLRAVSLFVIYLLPLFVAMTVPLSILAAFRRMTPLLLESDIANVQTMFDIAYLAVLAVSILVTGLAILALYFQWDFTSAAPAVCTLSFVFFLGIAWDEYINPVTKAQWFGAIALVLVAAIAIICCLFAAFEFVAPRNPWSFQGIAYFGLASIGWLVLSFYVFGALSLVVRHNIAAVSSFYAAVVKTGSADAALHRADTLPRLANGKALPTLATLYSQWIALRQQDIERWNRVGHKYPVFVVSAQGGGFYAAYYAALLLAGIQDKCPRFGDHVFAVSGVSGGALGAGVYIAATKFVDATHRGGAEILGCDQAVPGIKRSTLVKEFFSYDFLTPIVSSLIYRDLVTIPVRTMLALPDRGDILAKAFAGTWETTIGSATLPRYFQTPFQDHWNPASHYPALVTTATLVNNGWPVVFAPFSLSSPIASTQTHSGRVSSKSRSGLSFLEYYTLASRPMNVADAILASASFPYVTPARTLHEGSPIKGLPSLKLTDGGFFDNSASFAASEILTAVRSEPGRETAAVEFYFVRLLIDELGASTSVPDAWSDFLMPMQTLNNTRSIHQAAFEQASRAAVASEANLIDLRLLFQPDAALPLSWHLSERSKRTIDSQVSKALLAKEGEPIIGLNLQPLLALLARDKPRH